ncbi:Phosphoribosyl transferase domain-containing protein [Albimonas donghaensis]|uniref:Phosphoribosyl transferase domain-containing protein n=1 Tax=Albimonas donghaensis TaxID=356660 RepID=A0A1H2VCC5_9RHOB|nr:phosphoribosyltransferase [Albimonas donghaensis]SDW65584.1 Phosphoribosyl transferase domain-containing protein [Albimonas donghaensis]
MTEHPPAPEARPAPMRPQDFWQAVEPAEAAAPAPWTDRFPARLPDGRVLHLPIRPLAGTGNAIASLILNQASFAVEAALADALAERLAPFRPDIVAGLPTLGLPLARAVAERLGHARYAPFGTSRKFWYDEGLSVPLSSITSPDATRRLYLDPRLLPLVEGARVALVDDVISSGTSISAGLGLLARIGVTPVAVGCAMLQTERWRPGLAEAFAGPPEAVVGAFRSPLLARDGEGWREA